MTSSAGAHSERIQGQLSGNDHGVGSGGWDYGALADPLGGHTPERGDVDPVPGGTTPKKGELPPDPGNPPQDNGVIDPPDQVKGGNSDALPITPLPEDDVFGGTINPGPGDA